MSVSEDILREIVVCGWCEISERTIGDVDPPNGDKYYVVIDGYVELTREQRDHLAQLQQEESDKIRKERGE